MKTINAANKSNYKSSRDYVRLWELAQTERVICWLDYNETCTDIASTKCTIYDNGDVTIEISVRGTCYILGDTKEDFVRQCEKENVEFIEPIINIEYPDKDMREYITDLHNELWHRIIVQTGAENNFGELNINFIQVDNNEIAQLAPMWNFLNDDDYYGGSEEEPNKMHDYMLERINNTIATLNILKDIIEEDKNKFLKKNNNSK